MLEHIIGHENVKELLSNSIANGMVSHSYLLVGNEGIGKRTLAQEFAKIVLGVDRLEQCMDYVYLTLLPEKKNILVEQIREKIVNDVSIAPISCDRKVYLIDHAETLNEASQNSLLKTLEEPPKHVVILLIASSICTLLPTVLSRVNKIVMNDLTEQQVKDYAMDHGISCTDESLLSFAQGSIGLFLRINEQEYRQDFENIRHLFEKITNKNMPQVLQLIEQIDFSKEFRLDYFGYLAYHIGKHDWVVLAQNAKERLQYNGNYDIVIDNLILKCMESV